MANTPRSIDSSAASAQLATRERAFRVGVALAVSNTLIGASQPTLTRWGAVHLDPLLFCTGAVLIAAACSLVSMGRRGELGSLITRRFAPRLFTMAMVGTVATSLTLTYGLEQIDAVAGTILLQTEPIYSLILATIVVGERPSWRQLAATATILVGICSVFGAGGAFQPLWAAAMVFLTPVFWQSAHVIGLKIMPPLNALAITGGRMIYGALAMVVLLLVARPHTLPQLADPRAIAVIAVTGFFVYFMSALTWYGAINRLSLAWTTALVVPGIPLLSIACAVIFLGESANAREIIGVIIAISGVLALVLGSDAHRKHPDPEAAEAIHQPLN